MSVLKLAGRMMEDMGGVLQLYPINGKTGGAGKKHFVVTFFIKVSLT